MPAECNVEAMFDLIDPGPGHFLSRKTRYRLNALLMKLTGLERLRDLYIQIRSTETDTRFTNKILTCLGAKLEVAAGGWVGFQKPARAWSWPTTLTGVWRPRRWLPSSCGCGRT